MNIARVLISPVLIVVSLAGCGKSDLDCSSDAAQNLVLQIVKEHKPGVLLLAAYHGISLESAERATLSVMAQTRMSASDAAQIAAGGQGRLFGATYSLQAIRLSSKDQATGSLSCAAELHATLPEHPGGSSGVASAPITYKLDVTSDNKLYATISGLE